MLRRTHRLAIHQRGPVLLRAITMKTNATFTSTLLFAITLACAEPEPPPEAPTHIGPLIYSVSPGFCVSPCESYELYRSDRSLQLLVFSDFEYAREIRGELTPATANTLDEAADALLSGETELGELEPYCDVNGDAPKVTLELGWFSVRYPSICPPSGLTLMNGILSVVTNDLATCDMSIPPELIYATVTSCD